MREKMSAVKKRRYLRLVWERIALKEKKTKNAPHSIGKDCTMVDRGIHCTSMH